MKLIIETEREPFLASLYAFGAHIDFMSREDFTTHADDRHLQALYDLLSEAIEDPAHQATFVPADLSGLDAEGNLLDEDDED